MSIIVKVLILFCRGLLHLCLVLLSGESRPNQCLSEHGDCSCSRRTNFVVPNARLSIVFWPGPGANRSRSTERIRMGRCVGGPNQTSAHAQAPSKVSAGSASVAVKANLTPLSDGRTCLLCEEPDTAKDLVDETRAIAWAYAPDPKTRKNVGHVCYYCHRVFRARFQAKFRSVENLQRHFGVDLQAMQLFQHWRKTAVEAMVQQSSRDISIKWGTEEGATLGV